MMKNNSTKNEKLVTDFLHALENRESSEDLRKFYHDDVQQTEFPNAIVKNVVNRNLNEIIEASERGLKLLSREKYEVKNMYSLEDAVIMEARWQGTLAVPVGNLIPGDTMTAYFAQFFLIKDGKIFRQKNYDCFEPFN